MASTYPFFGIWVKDFLGDNRVQSMTTEEVGAYFLLLLMAWQEPVPGSIPDDDRLLARWARLRPSRWKQCRIAVLACFTKGEDGRLYQKRLRSEWERLAAVSSRRSKAGQAGAEKRWQTHAIASDLPMAKGMAKPCDSGYGSDCDSSERGKEGSGGKGETVPEALLALAWNEYCPRKATHANGKLEEAEREFAELLRLGHHAEKLDAEIRDKDRDRGEQLWQFRERIKRNYGQYNGSAARSDTGRSLARIDAPQSSIDAARRKTILCGEATAEEQATEDLARGNRPRPATH